MLTISQEELEPKIDEHFGSIGRIVTDDNGDPTGVTLWFLAKTQEEFDKAHENKALKTMRIKRMPELMKALRRRQGDHPPGSSSLIEIPEVPKDSGYHGYREVDKSPRILELNEPHFRSIGNAIRHLKNSGAKDVWIYKGGNEEITRTWENMNRYAGTIPGLFRPHYTPNGSLLGKLIPDNLRIKRGETDITQAAIDNGKNTIPLKGGLGIRRANKKGMGQTAFSLIQLTPDNFRRAVKAATNYSEGKDESGRKVKAKPMIYKWELCSLLHSIMNEISSALQHGDSYNGYRHLYFQITACDNRVEDIVCSLPSAFDTAESIKGLETKLWKEGEYHPQPKGFVQYMLRVWDSRECLQEWMKSEKYSGLKTLWPYVEKYGKRCHRMRVKLERERKIEAANKAARMKAAQQKFEQENHGKENSKEKGGQEGREGSPQADTQEVTG